MRSVQNVKPRFKPISLVLVHDSEAKSQDGGVLNLKRGDYTENTSDILSARR